MLFDQVDRAYFKRRAAEAKARAKNASDPTVALVHEQFAREYERRVGELAAESTLPPAR